ncbi:MAG: hypothetical protein QNJ81_03520 [Acidimicrobiia bacterium]|nr:hypothetical protein [Acidimicrobiia bacterium]
MADDCVCHDEIARLHRFFQDWFRGDLDEAAFRLCEEALAPGFTIVTPGGELIERDHILTAIRRHRGGEQPGFAIETVARSCQQVAGVHIASYEERQSGTRSTVRLSTAVLSEDGGRYRWHNVHETWITT